MFESIRSRVLQVFRVPHDPDPPSGAPGSIRVFRAGRNFYKLRLLRWGAGQLGALVGIIFSLMVLHQVQEAVEGARVDVKQPGAGVAVPGADQSQSVAAGSPTRPKAKSKFLRDGKNRAAVRHIADRWPSWLFGLLYALKWIGVVVYFVQIPITYAIARLDYELRWYIVTDRSLRIRAGLASVQETTMSFANVQQVLVTQGPLQRLLGISDVRVQSAGGGRAYGEHSSGDSLHTGVFHGVDNGDEIRDLVQERLRAFRQAGLGDPDDMHRTENAADHPAISDSAPPAALAAAREVLQEARQLRASFR